MHSVSDLGEMRPCARYVMRPRLIWALTEVDPVGLHRQSTLVYAIFVCFILLLFFSPLIHLDKGYLNKQYIGSAVQSIYYFNTCTSSALSTGFTIVFGCA
jgi:uncharacterized membrane protein